MKYTINKNRLYPLYSQGIKLVIKVTDIVLAMCI